MEDKIVEIGLPSPTKTSGNKSQGTSAQKQPDINMIYLEATSHFKNNDFTAQDIRQYTMDKYKMDVTKHLNDLKIVTRSVSRSEAAKKIPTEKEAKGNKRSLAEDNSLSAPVKKAKVVGKEKKPKNAPIKKTKEIKEKKSKDVTEKKTRATGKKQKIVEQADLTLPVVNVSEEQLDISIEPLESSAKQPKTSKNATPRKKTGAIDDDLIVIGKHQPILKEEPETVSAADTGTLGAITIKNENDAQIPSVTEPSAPNVAAVKKSKAGIKSKENAKAFEGKKSKATGKNKMNSENKSKAVAKIIADPPKKRGRPPGKKTVV